MVRSIFYQYLNKGISRRQFVSALATVGVGAITAAHLAESLAHASPGQEELRRLENKTGGQITCEALRLWGVQFVFGNTGGYEAPFVDALVECPDIQYILGLHEGSVMAMADGYARATGKTAFVNVHAITGTANALGLMVNAWADSSPVVITVGLSATSSENRGSFTETPNLESIPSHFSKLSFRVSRGDTLSESIRRAFQLASALPSGPVFLGVPTDVWAEPVAKAELIPPGRTTVDSRLAPDQETVKKVVDWLVQAKNPLLVAGAELPRWGGLRELEEIADLLGAVVSGDTSSSRSSMGFPSSHPRYLGPMHGPIESPMPFDLNFLAGASRLTLMGRHPLIKEDSRIVELGIREDHLARGYPADILIFAHPEETLKALLEEIGSRKIDPVLKKARAQNGEALKVKRKEEVDRRLQQVWNSRPIAPERLASEVNRVIDKDAVVVTETVSSDSNVWDYIEFDQPGGGRRHIVSSGGSLGWGLGAACGAKFGAPGKQIIALVGDGSYQFAVQALWTIKRFQVPLVIVIFNNRNYQANRWAQAGLRGQASRSGHYIGVNLTDPEIDHVGIARSYGIDGARVSEPDQLAGRLQQAVEVERSGKAFVVDVLIDRRGGGADSDWHETFSVASLR